MASQRRLDETYMACARAVAALSHAERKKVGAILVAKGNQGIIAEGVNGTPAGFDNCCEVPDPSHCLTLEQDGISFYCYDCDRIFDHPQQHKKLITKPEVLHAESNAIAKVARSTNSSEESTLYVTISPCFDCSKQIIQAGIKRVVYEEEYRLRDGIELLIKANIKIEKL